MFPPCDLSYCIYHSLFSYCKSSSSGGAGQVQFSCTCSSPTLRRSACRSHPPTFASAPSILSLHPGQLQLTVPDQPARDPAAISSRDFNSNSFQLASVRGSLGGPGFYNLQTKGSLYHITWPCGLSITCRPSILDLFRTMIE
ncbi:hypothetical protein YC2023_113886 [Brassica napus]